MSKKSNIEIIKGISVLGVLSYLGWLLFTGLNGLIPSLSSINPIWKVIISVFGIWIAVVLGFKEL